MAHIDSQIIIEDGLAVTLTALAATSNTFTNSGREFIYIENEGGGDVTITVDTIITTPIENNLYGDLTKADSVKVVIGGGSVMIGTFPVSAYNGNDSLVTFTVTTTTSVNVAILNIG